MSKKIKTMKNEKEAFQKIADELNATGVFTGTFYASNHAGTFQDSVTGKQLQVLRRICKKHKASYRVAERDCNLPPGQSGDTRIDIYLIKN